MQTVTMQLEPIIFTPAHWPISCGGNPSPGKDMPTLPAPDPPPTKKPAPTKKK